MRERVIAAAIRRYGLTISLPPPARHGDLLKPMHIATDAVLPPNDQNFLTSMGRFVGRIEATDIAIQSGQIKKLQWPPCLYSEDLW
jgi:hypothetical protein